GRHEHPRQRPAGALAPARPRPPRPAGRSDLPQLAAAALPRPHPAQPQPDPGAGGGAQPAHIRPPAGGRGHPPAGRTAGRPAPGPQPTQARNPCMSDDAQRWKSKYLESLEEQEKLEKRWDARLDLLRRGLVRSSLAAEGSDKAVDQCMQELREIIRGEQMDAGLAALIPRLEKAVLDS